MASAVGRAVALGARSRCLPACALRSYRFVAALRTRHYGTVAAPRQAERVDYRALVAGDMAHMADDMRAALATDNESLGSAARYYFEQQGKNFRPLTILLVAGACNASQGPAPTQRQPADAACDPSGVTSVACEKSAEVAPGPLYVTPAQRKIAMIAEMIHTASLVHDDVLDDAATRRGRPSVNARFGDRASVFAGDFILSRASVQLARIGNVDVIQLLSRVISDLVGGELLQLGTEGTPAERFATYIEKTFMKTASLLAYSCQAVAVLGSHGQEVADAAFGFGRNLGIAFQLVDDLLDFVSTSEAMGKPTAADLQLGLATAPVLFASEEYPELNPLIARKFKGSGDVQMARTLVERSNGLWKTRELAEEYCGRATQHLLALAPSQARTALAQIAEMVLNRKT